MLWYDRITQVRTGSFDKNIIGYYDEAIRFGLNGTETPSGRSIMGKKTDFYRSLYATRKLEAGYPDLKHLGSVYFSDNQEKKQANEPVARINNLVVDCFFRLVNSEELSGRALDIGCGPVPAFVKTLQERGFDAKGLEPVEEMRKRAQDFLTDESLVLGGSAEHIALPDSSVSFVVMNSVLEHVDSPRKTLNEIYRILEPGGVVFIATTNRYMFRNFEYDKLLFQWYPSILKESYVFMHLHYQPELAWYSGRPAVHWFCFSDLCKLGRDTGFHSFYSLIDLMTETDIRTYAMGGKVRQILLPCVKYNPFIRSLVLTFTIAGAGIFMVKRKA